MDHSSMNMTSDGSCKSSMLWNWYTMDACLLAESWHIKDNGMFAASCIGVILLVVCLEALRRISREYDDLMTRQLQRHIAAAQAANQKEFGGSSLCDNQGMQYAVFRASPLQQFIRATIYAVMMGLAYIIMLLAMTYNGYIIICIIIGAWIGKFLCDWMVVRVPVGGRDPPGAARGVEEPSACCG